MPKRKVDFQAIEHAEHELDNAKAKLAALRIHALLARGWNVERRKTKKLIRGSYDRRYPIHHPKAFRYAVVEYDVYISPDGKVTRALSTAFALCRNRARRECGVTDGR